MHGFLYNVPTKTFQPIDEPAGVASTTVNGINDLGQIVGFYVDAADHTVGFVGTPTPLPASVLFLGSGVLGLAGWRSFRKS